MNLINLTIEEIHKLYKKKEVCVEDMVKASLKRINETSSLETFSSIFIDDALNKAKRLDKKGIPENPPPLWGIPLAIKDNMCMEGYHARAGSKILENFISPYDGGVAKKIKENDAVIIGSCNMDEFAMGSSCENNPFAKVKNPYNLNHVPGGSSGGNAAAVSSCQVTASLGSDTGGSIRQPASFCGVFGLKPTYGLVSRYGLIAYASSLDQIGPIARTTKDTALILQSVAGYDKSDSTSLNCIIPDYLEKINTQLKGLKIGIPKEYFNTDFSKEVKDSISKGIKTLEDQGVILEEISLPHTEYAIAAYYVLATAEASANLARFDGIKYGYRSKSADNLKDVYIKSRTEGFGDEVKRRIILGTFVLSSGYYDAYYLKAQKVRSYVKKDFENAFKSVDIILTPTSPFTAFKIGEKINDPISMYLSDIFTVSVNLAGLPAISIPCGFGENNLPIGMQLIGKPLQEAKLLNASYQFEIHHQLKKLPLGV